MNKSKTNLSLKNNINQKYFVKNLYQIDKIKLNKIIKNIYNNLNDKKDTFHTLSRKFTINFKKSSLKKFTKHKSVILIGMGGSVLGARSIYYFLKKKN